MSDDLQENRRGGNSGKEGKWKLISFPFKLKTFSSAQFQTSFLCLALYE